MPRDAQRPVAPDPELLADDDGQVGVPPLVPLVRVGVQRVAGVRHRRGVQRVVDQHPHPRRLRHRVPVLRRDRPRARALPPAPRGPGPVRAEEPVQELAGGQVVRDLHEPVRCVVRPRGGAGHGQVQRPVGALPRALPPGLEQHLRVQNDGALLREALGEGELVRQADGGAEVEAPQGDALVQGPAPGLADGLRDGAPGLERAVDERAARVDELHDVGQAVGAADADVAEVIVPHVAPFGAAGGRGGLVLRHDEHAEGDGLQHRLHGLDLELLPPPLEGVEVRLQVDAPRAHGHAHAVVDEALQQPGLRLHLLVLFGVPLARLLDALHDPREVGVAALEDGLGVQLPVRGRDGDPDLPQQRLQRVEDGALDGQVERDFGGFLVPRWAADPELEADDLPRVVRLCNRGQVFQGLLVGEALVVGLGEEIGMDEEEKLPPLGGKRLIEPQYIQQRTAPEHSTQTCPKTGPVTRATAVQHEDDGCHSYHMFPEWSGHNTIEQAP